ncbi:MAG: PEP-CTERM sorting domain-containing protein [Gammaproteobacteria bacterium]|nr:PEP-CTERM sorting domain-containing protein [Gammaproteobacteria bacterium]MBV9622327.1 PEP-CTERM sorting domain-containing protein [Gammaproteobacteria bacterium]
MVDVLQLQGNANTSLNGDFEVLFDYPLGSPCPVSAGGPSLTWANVTYVFSGSGSTQPCSATNDFLFSSSGSLVGALPSGWSVKATGVPEPGTVGLLGLALVILALLRLRELRRQSLSDHRWA